MMKLENVVFELETKTRDTAFYLFKTERGLDYAVDCSFESKEFYGEKVSPSLCINSIMTNVFAKEALVGKSFCVKSIEEADEREDTFYVYEHEPLEKYILTVLDIDNDTAHIECKGIAVLDGYAKPYQTGEFSINCWLPIITSASDWGKFGL